MRTRYLWFMTVSIIYVLLVFVLHRNLHHFNVPDITDDVDVDGGQLIIDDNASHVDEWRGLVFPVVRLCVGPSLAAPSGLVPLGPDWLYTAYFDDRLRLNPKSVYIRIFALLRRRLQSEQKPTFYFRWSQSGTGDATTAVAEMYEMCENHGRRYGGWILSAKFVGRRPPCSVIVIHNLTQTTAVRLPVFRMRADDHSTVEEENNSSTAGLPLLRRPTGHRTVDRRKNFAVCVPPLYGAIVPATLVQFIELTRLLGADHVVFYVNHVSEPVQRVLDAYEADDVVTAIPWVLPSTSAQFVWYNGQLLAANDCLYRTSHAFHYVAFNDIDEFIVPQSATNWTLMLADLASGVDRGSEQRAKHQEQISQSRSV